MIILGVRKKTVTISLVTTPAIADALRNAAKEQERSLSWVIGKALERYLGIGEGSPKSSVSRKSGSR